MKPLAAASFKPAGKYDEGVPERSRICEFDTFYATLPPRVVKWAGMASDEGVFETTEMLPDATFGESLVQLNDGGLNFEEIADAIEARIDEL